MIRKIPEPESVSIFIFTNWFCSFVWMSITSYYQSNVSPKEIEQPPRDIYQADSFWSPDLYNLYDYFHLSYLRSSERPTWLSVSRLSIFFVHWISSSSPQSLAWGEITVSSGGGGDGLQCLTCGTQRPPSLSGRSRDASEPPLPGFSWPGLQSASDWSDSWPGKSDWKLGKLTGFQFHRSF